MPHQEALTVRVGIKPAQYAALDELLTKAGRKGNLIPFADLRGVHFARLVLLPEALDLEGATISPSLLYLCEVDGPASAHLPELVEKATDGLDRLFTGCDGYPLTSAEARVVWLREHTLPAAAYYVNTVGRGLEQIRQEALLREEIEDFLDRSTFDGQTALDVRAAILSYIRDRSDLSFAFSPPEAPALSWRAGELVHRVGLPLAALALLPVELAAAPLAAALLRWQERGEVPHEQRPDPARRQAIEEREDHVAQNPFTAVGFAKPSVIRRLTLNAGVAALDYGIRHVFNRRNLAGVTTIHFFRWMYLDGGRRAIFASNYDGSLESYMDDFIDKLAWGLNAVFSNGLGYPRTRWLLLDGAKDERTFKNYLHTHQVRTHLWYSAYENLTTRNIENNARIRAGLNGEPTLAEAQAWLALL